MALLLLFLKLKSPRLVGWAIRGNQDRSIPCHRVVFKDGSLASHYSFGGITAQKENLVAEGITFNSQNKVKLSHHLFSYDKCS